VKESGSNDELRVCWLHYVFDGSWVWSDNLVWKDKQREMQQREEGEWWERIRKKRVRDGPKEAWEEDCLRLVKEMRGRC